MTSPKTSHPTATEPATRLRIGREVLAHLRGVAQGLSVTDSARIYLRADGRSAPAAHREAVEAATRAARRAGLGSAWRLLAAPQIGEAAHSSLPDANAPPQLDAWAEAEGMEDWPHDELQALYQQRFGTAAGRAGLRKAAQADRLRRARLALLHRLETYSVEPAAWSDAVDLWFAPPLAARLISAGLSDLGLLSRTIDRGGRWWKSIEAFGPRKAARLAEQVRMLTAHLPRTSWLAPVTSSPLDLSTSRRSESTAEPDRASPSASALLSPDDAAAITGWLASRSRATQTERAYRKEAERFALWLRLVRG
ncbi:MAG: hypothetical protein EOO22_24565, partial [Comamonadaceae bacterium]